ncbi:tetratricopeptide repeat protein [Noviluteimonas gilva]|uniref:Tetratricopeptide repeat protein n=1 Tax=Noviluteimonas gilva TaxID=2682097 RepID=A0A7C9M2J2_9GAMM|nr:tetratricopeptide repeat protein [Lysobacter gilvus]MUV13826.1 tetratricopeptide repeat protein [Lysobacter gilvus]
MTPRSSRLQDHLAPLAFAGVLLLAFLAYRPGLSGGFLFDDLVNLPALGKYGPIVDAPAFWRYITSGFADPTGRPFSLLTFLIDARDWPTDAAPFLRTNLVLHLLNGALLFVLLRVLGGRLADDARTRDGAALVGAGLWVLHPLFVSTTLYIVQREAMLPATFTLLGLLAWVHGRARLTDSPRTALLWMVVVFGACTVLAVASKANGALLPVLAWVIDSVILRRNDPTQSTLRLRALRAVMLILPSVLIFGWLLSKLPAMHVDLASRPWTVAQRLLTEPRVLVDYLQLLAVPRVLSTGLYNDAYVASTGLASPASTWLAIVFVLALVATAFALRRRAPVFACALLFFFAGHLIESTILALELYYEHRNYLPALLLGWPIGRALMRWKIPAGARIAIVVLMFGGLATITWQRASLWARQDEMAALWARTNPASSRAQATAAIFEMRAGRPDLAIARLQPLSEKHPADLQLAVNLADARCAARGLRHSQVDAVSYALRNATEGDALVVTWLADALNLARTRACRGLNLEAVDTWIAAARANPRFAAPPRQQELHSIAGDLALTRREPDAALIEFDRALDAWPTPQAALQQAAMLASAGCYAQARDHLDHLAALQARDSIPHLARATGAMSMLHETVLHKQRYWTNALVHMRTTLDDDLRQHGATQCR